VLRSTKKILPSGMMHGWPNELVPALKFTFFAWEVRRSGSGESGVVVWRAARRVRVCCRSMGKKSVHHTVTQQCVSAQLERVSLVKWSTPCVFPCASQCVDDIARRWGHTRTSSPTTVSFAQALASRLSGGKMLQKC
jgi:hypothetical protein